MGRPKGKLGLAKTEEGWQRRRRTGGKDRIKRVVGDGEATDAEQR